MKNPQAFPQFSFTIDGRPHEPGMTLRDHFAGLAIQGLCKSATEDGWRQEVVDGYAAQAYSIADAMLVEREK